MEASRPEPRGDRVESSAVPDQDAPTPQPEGSAADLLTISLLVFFVSILLIVTGMLVLPSIVH